MARRLLDPDCAVLAALGGVVPFELAVGANGLVWVQAASTKHTVAVTNTILRCESLSDAEAQALVRAVLPKLVA
jgi:exosome complex component RRP40